MASGQSSIAFALMGIEIKLDDRVVAYCNEATGYGCNCEDQRLTTCLLAFRIEMVIQFERVCVLTVF